MGMNARKARVIRLGNSLAVILPKDWTRGMEVERGQLIEMVYNGEVRIIAIPKEEAHDGAAKPG